MGSRNWCISTRSRRESRSCAMAWTRTLLIRCVVVFLFFGLNFLCWFFRIPVYFRPWLRNEWFRAWNRAWRPGNWTILLRRRRLHWRCVIRTMPSWRPALPWPISTRRPRTSLAVGAFVLEFSVGWNGVQALWKIDCKNWMPYLSYCTHLRLIDWLND